MLDVFAVESMFTEVEPLREFELFSLIPLELIRLPCINSMNLSKPPLEEKKKRIHFKKKTNNIMLSDGCLYSTEYISTVPREKLYLNLQVVNKNNMHQFPVPIKNRGHQHQN